jgi:hypothetical protein
LIQAITECKDIGSLKSVLSVVELSDCLFNHALGIPNDLHMHILKSLLPFKFTKFSLSIHLSGYSSKVLGWIQNTCTNFNYKTLCVHDTKSFCCLDVPSD